MGKKLAIWISHSSFQEIKTYGDPKFLHLKWTRIDGPLDDFPERQDPLWELDEDSIPADDDPPL